jgi:DNA-binding transcriptional regulator YiaG
MSGGRGKAHREPTMATTDENKAARTQQSQEVAHDAAEAYRAAVTAVLVGLEDNADKMRANDATPLPIDEWNAVRRSLREEARVLVKQGRQLDISRTRMAAVLGVSRQTIHEWIGGGES